jgi:hypothetical protein
VPETFATPDEQAFQGRASDLSTDIGETTAAEAGEAFMSGTREMARIGEYNRANAPTLEQADEFRLRGPLHGVGVLRSIAGEPYTAPVDVPIADAQARLKAEGITDVKLPDQPTIRQGVLDLMIDHARERQAYNAAVSRGPQGFWPGAASFATSIGVGILDPVNAAAFSVPVLGEARTARIIQSAGDTLFGRAAAKFGVGALQGGVGSALLEPANWWLHTQDGQDYTYADTLRSIAMGIGMGGVFHAGFGLVGDLRARASGAPLAGSPEEALFKALLADRGIPLRDAFPDDIFGGENAEPAEPGGPAGGGDAWSRMSVEDLRNASDLMRAGRSEADVLAMTPDERAAAAAAPHGGAAGLAQFHEGVRRDTLAALDADLARLRDEPDMADIFADLPAEVRGDLVHAATADILADRPGRAGELLAIGADQDPRIAESVDPDAHRARVAEAARRAIHNDVATQLRAAGMPEDQVEANAAVVAARYAARAARLGEPDAHALYRREGLSIRAAGGDHTGAYNQDPTEKALQAIMAALEEAEKHPSPHGLDEPTERVEPLWRRRRHLVDPNAAEWDLYHGSPRTFDRFDPNALSPRAGANPEWERGAVFFSPDPHEAEGYSSGEEGGVYRVRVRPGKTRVFDLAHLFEHDEAFHEAVRRTWHRQEEVNPDPARRRIWTPEYTDRALDRVVERARDDLERHNEATARARETGVPEEDLEPWSVPYGWGPVNAVIEQAQREGLDTAIIRGLRESHGGDQVIALNPGHVTSRYAGHVMYQGGAGIDGPRGRIMLGESRAIVDLFRSADASTFMHEMGHKWLDELVRDARAANVPQALKDDLGTVLRWLGVDRAEDIGRDQHEQFARGFERYLADGQAPSRGLAAAFAKFKDWLTQIYRGLVGAGQEISPEIRGVFDRMLASDEEIAAARGPTSRSETAVTINGETRRLNAEWNPADVGAQAPRAPGEPAAGPGEGDAAWRQLAEPRRDPDADAVAAASRAAAEPDPASVEPGKSVSAAEQEAAKAEKLLDGMALTPAERTHIDDALRALAAERDVREQILRDGAACLMAAAAGAAA